MAGMIAAQQAGKMTAQFIDLCIAYIRVEDFFQYFQLFRPDQLLIIQKTTILYQCGIHGGL